MSRELAVLNVQVDKYFDVPKGLQMCEEMLNRGRAAVLASHAAALE